MLAPHESSALRSNAITTCTHTLARVTHRSLQQAAQLEKNVARVLALIRSMDSRIPRAVIEGVRAECAADMAELEKRRELRKQEEAIEAETKNAAALQEECALLMDAQARSCHAALKACQAAKEAATK